MERLYRRSKLGFALLWIGLYIVLFSLADSCSAAIGIQKIVTAPLCLLMTAFLLYWLARHGLGKRYGLCRFARRAKDYLYFLPLFVLCTVNVWFGVSLRFSVVETALYVISMLCVGFIEEVLFRGFLFRAMLRQGQPKTAIFVSSITFGIGHIVNLLNGAAVFSTLLQIVYATAIGFLFTILVYRGGSLLPCIAAHSVTNALSAFAVDTGRAADIFAAVVLTGVSVGYALWIERRTRPRHEEEGKTIWM